MLGKLPRCAVDPVGDIRREAEISRRVEDPQMRDIAVIAAGTFERLLFTLALSTGPNSPVPSPTNSWP